MPQHKTKTLSLERLESRELMAGDVTATLSYGNLWLTEAVNQTNQENSVIISQLANGQIRVAGNFKVDNDGAKSRINGQAFQDFTVPGSLYVKFAGNSDRVIFSDDPGATPHFSNAYIDVAATSPGTLKDADQVFVFNAVTSGKLSINTGADHDWISIGDGANLGTLNIGRDLLVNSGAGADTVNILTHQGSLVHGNIDIEAFDSLAENDADAVWLDGVVSAGNIVVNTGGGNDSVHLSNTQSYHRTGIDTGTGDDKAELINTLAIDELFAYMNDGKDQLSVDGITLGQAGKAYFNGGNGVDSLSLKNLGRYAGQVENYNWEYINGFAVLNNGSKPKPTGKV